MANTNTLAANDYKRVWQDYVPDIAWGTVLLFGVYLAGYYVVIDLALSGVIPYALATIFCAYLAYVGFTVMHDAGHGSIVKVGSKYKPLETLMGWMAGIPLLISPFPFFRRIHDRHHAFTNDPDRDPDHYTFGDKWYQVALNCLYIPIRYHWLSVTELRDVKVTSIESGAAANMLLAFLEGRIRQYVRSEFTSKPLVNWPEQWSFLARNLLVENDLVEQY